MNKKEFRNLNLSKKQAISIIEQRGVIKIFNGSIRVGKSMLASANLAEFIYENSKSGNFYEYGCLAYSTTTAYKNLTSRVYVYLKYELGVECEIVGNDIRSKWFTVSTYGANNKRSVGQIQGATLLGLAIDEAGTLNKETLEMGVTRLETYKEKAFCIMTTNPEGSKSHWFYKDYILKNFTINFKMTDNPTFNNGDIIKMKKKYSSDMFKRKILGLWTASTGAIYTQKPKVIKQSDLPEFFDEIMVGQDEGRVDATTLVVVGLKDNKYYILSEYYHKDPGSNKDVTVLAKEQIQYLNAVSTHYKSLDYRVATETNPGTYFLLFKNSEVLDERWGVHKVRKNQERESPRYKILGNGESAIQQRITGTQLLISQEKLFICDNVINLQSSFDNAVWDQHNQRLDDGSYNVDSLDAFEYAWKHKLKHILRDSYNI